MMGPQGTQGPWEGRLGNQGIHKKPFLKGEGTHICDISWAFPASVFQRKPLFGPDLLLRHLRGEKIDWEELKGHCHKKRKALPQESDSDEEVGKCRRRESAPRSKRAMSGKQGKEHSEAISEGDAWEQMCQSRRSSKNRLSLHVSKTRRQKPRPAQKFGIAGDTAQAMTLQCHGCEERKLLQAFSKVQRATADTARCKNCCQDKKNDENATSQIVLVCLSGIQTMQGGIGGESQFPPATGNSRQSRGFRSILRGLVGGSSQS